MVHVTCRSTLSQTDQRWLQTASIIMVEAIPISMLNQAIADG
jgi:hypothetical protein